MKLTAIIDSDDGQRRLHLKGRLAWALNELVNAGSKGVTSLHNPGPRLSHYVMCLRRKGIHIDTIREKHGGPFPGEHGFYRLACDVTIEREVA